MIKQTFTFIGCALLIVAMLIVGVYFIPWQKISWGKLELLPASAVTVTGEAKTQQKSQVATFTAGVTAVNDNKETAIAEVNDKIEALVAAVKAFGIDSADIQTQNLNVYRNEETYYEEGRQKTRPGQWRVNNSISIKLKDVDRVAKLAELLTSSGATEVYGPSFTVDDTKEAEAGLVSEAMADARKKAEAMAAAAGRSLGKVLSVTEGSNVSGVRPMYEGMGAGGGGGIEPGSSTVYKTMTVTFELK